VADQVWAGKGYDVVCSDAPVRPVLHLTFPEMERRAPGSPVVVTPEEGQAFAVLEDMGPSIDAFSEWPASWVTEAKAKNIPTVSIMPFPDGARFRITAKRLDGDGTTGLEAFKPEQWVLGDMRPWFANRTVFVRLWYRGNVFGREILTSGEYELVVCLRLKYVCPDGRHGFLEPCSAPERIKVSTAPRDASYWSKWLHYVVFYDRFTSAVADRSRHFLEILAQGEAQKAPIRWTEVGMMAYPGADNAKVSYDAFLRAYTEKPQLFSDYEISDSLSTRFREVAAILGKPCPVGRHTKTSASSSPPGK